MLPFYCRLFIMAFGFFLNRDAWGRWSHHDADSLDRMTQLGTEYYNDILSYRDPWLWEDLWRRTSLGLRTSAGSMNKKELFYIRHIRIRSSTTDSWQLAYVSELQEEPKRLSDNSYLELSYGPEQQTWRFGLLGDGTTEKSFADLGMNVSWAPSGESWYQLVYWSVDSFYTEKKLEQQDFRTRNPASLELHAQQKWGRFSVRIRHAQDQPVVWHRPLRDQYYTYRHQETEMGMEYSEQESQQFYATLQQEQSREGISPLSRDPGQSYFHKEHVAELGLREKQGREYILWAVWGLLSRTQVQDRWMNRREAAFLWNWSSPMGAGEHRQDWGLTVNQVSLQELDSVKSTEVKVNWGPDFQIGRQGRFKLNSTWDIDQLVNDFPFRKKAFHSWGGGQASFLVHF